MVEHKSRSITFLEPPRPRIRPWVIPLWGFLWGALAGVILGHPLSMIVKNIHDYFYGRASLELGRAILSSFSPHMWPMILLYAGSSGFFGFILGWFYQRLQESRLRLEMVHQEFEIQVATLRHHYKNLAIGIHGFTQRIKKKVAALEEHTLNRPSDQGSLRTLMTAELSGLKNYVRVLDDTSQRLSDTLSLELRVLKALVSNSCSFEQKDLYPVLFNSIQDLLSIRFHEKALRVEVNGHAWNKSGGQLIFPFEPYTMEVVLQNILSNAMKYADYIQILISEKPETVWIEVRDNGPGVDIERLRGKLTSPLDRQDESSTHLGLKVSLHLVDRCGGRLGVESAPGQGSAFYLVFPKQ